MRDDSVRAALLRPRLRRAGNRSPRPRNRRGAPSRDGVQIASREGAIDAESVVVAALYALAERGELDRAAVAQAVKDLGLDPDRPAPWTV